ncbi:MAG: YciI family protein [Candidatus Cybelea sp.]
MKYACLIYGDGNLVDPLPPEEMEKLEAEGLAFDQELRRSGHFIAAQALERAHAATTIRRRNGELSMTDGPFAETIEQLGGFFLIEARDLNEAIRIASAHPCTHWDAIEIRPVRELYPGS